MSNVRRSSREQRSTILSGMLAFVLILVILQLWLLRATMNAYLGGDDSVVWPAALASLGCLALNAGLLRYLLGNRRQFDRPAGREQGDGRP